MPTWLADLLDNSAALVLIAGILLLILRDKLITASRYERDMALVRERHAEARADRDEWRAIAQAKDETIQELVRQVDQLMETARLGRAVLTAIPQGGEAQ